MMAHTLQFQEETAADVIFACSICGELIGFNKPGIGEPFPILVAGAWQPPENPDQWMSPCTA